MVYDGEMILGIDEVGRGAWAGPMVVGAVVLGDARINGLTDSKKLTKRMRERLDLEIRQKAAGIGLGWVSARMIDEIGLSAALKLAARRAVAGVGCGYDEIIIDGTIRLVDGPAVTLLKKADLLIPAVSAASIVAKVARDAYMAHLDEVFEGYGFASHVGYGTVAHLAAIRTNGVAPIHRRSFAPIAAELGNETQNRPVTSSGLKNPVAPTTLGNRAEDEASNHLLRLGHTIIERNWRTKRCEIDIVSRLHDILYFTEVKYRRDDTQGGGIAAITPKKLAQMTYASEIYVAARRLSNHERRLSVISMTGTPPTVESYIESI